MDVNEQGQEQVARTPTTLKRSVRVKPSNMSNELDYNKIFMNLSNFIKKEAYQETPSAKKVLCYLKIAYHIDSNLDSDFFDCALQFLQQKNIKFEETDQFYIPLLTYLEWGDGADKLLLIQEPFFKFIDYREFNAILWKILFFNDLSKESHLTEELPYFESYFNVILMEECDENNLEYLKENFSPAGIIPLSKMLEVSSSGVPEVTV